MYKKTVWKTTFDTKEKCKKKTFFKPNIIGLQL